VARAPFYDPNGGGVCMETPDKIVLATLSRAKLAKLPLLWPASSSAMALAVVEPMHALSLRHLSGGGLAAPAPALAEQGLPMSAALPKGVCSETCAGRLAAPRFAPRFSGAIQAWLIRLRSSERGPACLVAIISPTCRMRARSSAGALGTARPRKLARNAASGRRRVCQSVPGHR
jgi:hypothetical protein